MNKIDDNKVDVSAPSFMVNKPCYFALGHSFLHLPQTSSPQKLSQNGADVSPSSCERTPTPRMEEPAAPAFTSTCSSNRSTIDAVSSSYACVITNQLTVAAA